MTIPKFKRVATMFNGGDCPRHINDLMGRHEYEEPGEVKIVKCVNEAKDIWLVRMMEGRGTIYAYGDDMTPHPESKATNIEAVAHLMEHGQTAFTQAFILEAAIRYADQLLADEAASLKAMEGSFISGALVISTAHEVRDYLNAHLKG